MTEDPSTRKEEFTLPVIKLEEDQAIIDYTPTKHGKHKNKELRTLRSNGSNTSTPRGSSTSQQMGIPGGTTRRRRSSSRASSKNLKSSTDISPASMIFRNLLILEDDLRRQAHEQKVLKWQFTLFLSGLMGVAGFSFYEMYFSSEGVQGLYKVILQFILIFIMVTVVLFHLSGEYRRTIVIPRKFFTSTNKGIRQFNVKLVKVKSSISDRVIDVVRRLSRKIAKFNLCLLRKALPERFVHTNYLYKFWSSVAIRSQPRIGAVDVKLVLNPRAFSAEIREGWEIYRDEFWAREGARRRKQVYEMSPKKE